MAGRLHPVHYTGLRIGELRALRWRDVDFANATLQVRRNAPTSAPADFVARTATVGDGLADMRIGAQHRIALRIALDESRDREDALRAAGATHVMGELHAAGGLFLS